MQAMSGGNQTQRPGCKSSKILGGDKRNSSDASLAKKTAKISAFYTFNIFILLFIGPHLPNYPHVRNPCISIKRFCNF